MSTLQEPLNPRQRATLVDALSSSIDHGEQSLGLVPGLLCRIIKEHAWQDFQTKMGKTVHHDSFESFVTARALDGLGTTVQVIYNIVKEDKTTLDLLDQALQRPDGNPSGANQYQEGTVDNVNSSSRPSGNSTSQALRRLRKDRPDLHARVLANELSSHAAMIEAGFRKKAVMVDLNAPNAAERIMEKANQDILKELLRLLLERSNQEEG